MLVGFEAGMAPGLAHQHCTDAEPDRCVAQAEEERCGPQSVVGGEIPGDDGGHRDGAVSGGFVEPHRQAALPRAHEVDFHHHGGRPGEPLAESQQ